MRTQCKLEHRQRSAPQLTARPVHPGRRHDGPPQVGIPHCTDSRGRPADRPADRPAAGGRQAADGRPAGAAREGRDAAERPDYIYIKETLYVIIDDAT